MTTTDPEEARRRADEAAEQARAQLDAARSQMAGTAARARRSKWLLDSNHLGELFAQALGLQK
jgi:hypothetical protein